MKKQPMLSVSGVRGIVGDTLTPEIVVRYVQPFAQQRRGKSIVVGGDPRVSHRILRPLVKATIMASGASCIDIGIAPTPTVQLATERLKASGGIAITASHNPIQWNGLKFIGADGLFLSEKEIQELFRLAELKEYHYANWKELGEEQHYGRAIDDHLDAIFQLPYIDLELIRRQRFRIALDCVNGAGGVIVPRLLEKLGCTVYGINLETSGVFAHTPEPVPQNLTHLAALVKEKKADLGIAVDPDVDRLALIGNDGNPLGEEYTLALAVKFILSKKLGPVVVNLSTSRVIEDIVQYYNCTLYRTKVGEVHVARKMRQVQAVIGGEGNGGVILPEVHLGRDAPVGIALILQLMAETGERIAELKQSLPQYYILKDKVSLQEVAPEKVLEYFARKYADEKLDFTDGLRIDRPDSWIHLRKSNTEPIIRIIVEAATPDIAWQILQATKSEINNLKI